MRIFWLGVVVASVVASAAYGATSAPAGLTSKTADCVIKGNINGDGVHIYHTPGQAYYDRTEISPGKGERWFCTETEARAAGWRKAKV